ncbi:MAG: hypothetical protein AB7I04_01610 [Pseudomonadales bacterium]
MIRSLPVLRVGALILGLCLQPAAYADDFSGTWTLTLDTPNGVQNPTLVIEQNGDGYSGVYNSRRGPIEIPEIKRDGNAFAFPLTISVPIGEVQVDYRGTFAGDEMQGSVQSPRGEVPFTAKKTAP